MANMIPDLTESQLSEIESKAEVQVYKALKEGLPNSYFVFSQVAWILKRENDEAKDGETDFVIVHPNFGYLCIEVKGGGLSFDAATNQWFSTDRYGQKNLIKDPIRQALKAKYSIRTKLFETEEWKLFGVKKITYGHAVFFPDIRDSKLLERPDMPAVLIGTNNHLTDIKKWVEGCVDFWTDDDQMTTPIGHKGLDIFKKVFAKSFFITPLISNSLKTEEEARILLTNEQVKLLDILRKKRRVVVSGGAGTGKTILAVEKAKRLASEGFSTLLTCYNRPLADHLSEICKNTNGLTVMSFHQLCHTKIKEAKEMSGIDLLEDAKKTYPGEDEFDVQLPNALACSLDIIADRYDAIVCDEGQDFREEYWLPLELMLSDEKSSPFYIFYDDNQNLYSRVSTFPIGEDEIYPLSRNCRNTVQIHKASYRYYNGDPVEHSNLDGLEPQFEVAMNINNQANKIHSRIQKLLLEEQVDSSKIAILIVDAKNKRGYLQALEKQPLPRGHHFSDIEQRNDSSVLVTTVNRFKGLESEIVFLWGMDSIDIQEHREQLYVGLSRAKSILVIFGNKQTCSYFQTE
ncbi:nuclease-related domain-containing DEAD/DEAH box helicase [Paenibacillus sp. YYML68]|uniref:nuclease-related domain-containing DEAD/DEAH box helicase n=1 Tax=Paenibacillus sp. YYML68 TaxID=2909250 RepID=UPI0024931D4C|nr:nuclease-related domain-containing DEAD/DEAH box helicase [Paenibacillus sp. YYML68]